MTLPGRRTKRRYAHELYPHPDEGVVRPLEVEVPYLYSRVIGFDVDGTSWYEAEAKERGDRIAHMIQSTRLAMLADALLQGMAGDEAWSWAMHRAADETSEIAWDRAVHYGVPVGDIKPYPCGPAPTKHAHLTPVEGRSYSLVTYVPGAEDDCEDCTEPVDPGAARDE